MSGNTKMKYYYYKFLSEYIQFKHFLLGFMSVMWFIQKNCSIFFAIRLALMLVGPSFHDQKFANHCTYHEKTRKNIKVELN